jgi:hypothetical protein
VQSEEGVSAIIVREPLRRNKVVVEVVLASLERDSGDHALDLALAGAAVWPERTVSGGWSRA